MAHPIDKLVPPASRTDEPFISLGPSILRVGPGACVIAKAFDDATAKAIAECLNLAAQADADWIRGLLLRVREQEQRAMLAEQRAADARAHLTVP